MIDLTAIIPDLLKGGDISDFISHVSKEKTASQEKIKSAIVGLMATDTPYVVEKQTKGEKIGSGDKPTTATMLMNLVEESGAKFFHNKLLFRHVQLPINLKFDNKFNLNRPKN